MGMQYHVPVLCFCLITVATLTDAVTNPGLKIRLSQPGINYAANVAVQKLTQQIKTLRIPDQSGSAHMDVGHVDYSISNIRVIDFNPPSNVVTTKPFRWTLTGTSAKLTADWRYKYRAGFIKVSDHGSVDISISLNLAATINLGMDSNGRPTISCQSCSSDITHVDVHFHGGASWLYNLFSSNVEHAVKDSLRDEVCSSIKRVVDEQAESELATLPMQVAFHDTVVLDYSMVAAPNLTVSYMDFLSKGEFFWIKDKQEYPFPAKPTQEPAKTNMLAFWITEYSLNTLGYVEYKHGTLVYNLTKADLPDENQYILDTTCESLFKPCIGGIIPKVGQMYPNSTVVMDMAVTEAPTIHVNVSGISGKWTGKIRYEVQLKNKTSKFLFSTNLNVSFDLDVSMNNTYLDPKCASLTKSCSGKISPKIFASIKTFQLHMTLEKSAIGDVKVDNLNIVMDLAIKQFVIPKLNELGEEGMDLPAIDDVVYLNPVLQKMDHALYVGVDLKYIG